MKSIKYFIAVIALVFTVGAIVAFTGKEEKEMVLNPVWYIYDGQGEFDEPTSYTKDGVNIPSECDTGVDRLCAVLLPDNGTNPDESDLDPAFVSHIEEVIMLEVEDDQTVRLKAN